MMITLPIPVNSLCPNGRAHWRTKASATKAHRALAKARTLEALGGQPAPKYTGYSLAFYFKNVRGRDDDNATASCKAYRDGIADALGIDDNQLRLLGEPIMEIDRLHPRVEVTLKSEDPAAGPLLAETTTRFADTPETNSHLGRHANSPDDTAMWLEIGLPRKIERDRNHIQGQMEYLIRGWQAMAAQMEQDAIEANQMGYHLKTARCNAMATVLRSCCSDVTSRLRLPQPDNEAQGKRGFVAMHDIDEKYLQHGKAVALVELQQWLSNAKSEP